MASKINKVDQKKALIVGAGVAGQELLAELQKNLQEYFQIVGFVDDDPEKQGQKINSLPVLGQIDSLSEIIKENEIAQVFIAIPSAYGAAIRRVINQCQKEKVIFRIVPRTLELVQGKVKLHRVREVQIEDLLGRAILQSEQEAFKQEFEGKKVLVTGAAGSIGSELCRQLVQFSPELLVGVDWRESPLYEVERELETIQGASNFEMIIGSVQDFPRVKEIFQEIRPEIVFHAAAFKHVPMMQEYPSEAVKNNVFGTENVARAAVEEGVKKFINISTDKAVSPTSVMGATKLLTEYIVSSYNQKGKTQYSSVRFGNVLASEGSVVPLFEKQISNGGPVTITDEHMTRYFMTIPEAVQLVLQASVLGKGGEIFVLDMGEPVKITELAELMIRLAGFAPNEEIKIKIVGRRPGEKMTEELSTEKEELETTENEKIYKISPNGLDDEDLKKILTGLKKAIDQQDQTQIYKELKKIAPNLQDISIPLTRPVVDEEEVEAVSRVIKSGWMTMGQETVKFEEEFAKYVGAKYAVAVNSCTSALFLALKALGIGEDDEVVVPSFTFASTVSMVVQAGAVPVFADINQEAGFVMTQKTFEKARTKRTKAVIPVHYGGNRSYIQTDLPIIEDSAHLIPKNGDNLKAFASCYSFYATKNITTGEGGMITTSSKKDYEWFKKARLHGLSRDAWKRYDLKSKWTYTVEFPGYKVNTTDINSALGRVQLKKLDSFEKRRREVVGLYNKLLGLNNQGTHLYPILMENRDKFFEYVKQHRIGCSFHFTPLHLQPAFKKYSKKKLPVTEYIGSRVVTIPLDARITDREVRKVASIVKNFKP